MIDMAVLGEFLVEAKKRTYADSNAAKVAPSREGSNDYHYERVMGGQKMAYHDCYFGGTQFMGEEVVYCEGKPIWGMNYRGETLDTELSEAAVDAALRPALSRVGEDSSVLPVRGPKRFERDGYAYEFEAEGDLGSFHGTEKIFAQDGKLVYRLSCQGGVIE